MIKGQYLYNVLYVDDEPDLCDLAKIYLEMTQEFSVETANSGKDALTLLKSRQYDAIIADYQMPQMDGLDFLKQLRSEGYSTPFVIFTGRGREEIVIEALNSGADFYLQKGGDPKSQFAELRSKVLQAISRRRAEERVEYLSRINSLISHVNKNIVRIRNREELFRTICDVAIDQGKFRMAWIGIIDHSTHLIIPVAWAGMNAGEFLNGLTVSIDAIPEGLGPAGRAAREEKPVIINDILNEPVMHPWQKAAAKFDFLSAGGFPLWCKGKVVGILSIYAVEPDFFSQEEIALLEEVTADISYALDNLELEKERVSAVESLKISEEKYRSILENIQDVYYRMDANGKIVMVSPSGADLLGYANPDEIIGKSAIDFFADPQEAERFLSVLKKEGRVTDFEATAKRKDGTHIVIAGSSHVLLDSNRNYAGAEGIFHDVTARKAAESALIESEKRYRDIFEINDAIMLIIDPETGKIVDANESACRFYGYTRDELTGLNITHLNIQDPQLTHFDMIHAKGSKGAVFQFRHRKKDGGIRNVEVFSGPIVVKGHTLLHSIIQDVTERVNAERVLRESESRYRNLFNNMLEGFAYCRMIYNADGTPSDFIYLDVNPSFDRIIGVKTVIGKPVTEVFPGIKTAFPQLFEIYGKVASTGEPASFDLDFSPVGKWLHISVYGPQKDHFVAVFEDITIRKQAEEEIRKAEEKYRKIFETALEGIYQISPKGKLLTVNPAMARILGYDSTDEIISMISDTARQLWAHQEQREEYLRQLKHNNVVRNFECEFFRKDRSTIWVSLTTHTVRNDDGKILISEGILVDITQRKTSERELIEREEEYRNILRTAMDGFCIISSEREFLDVNDAFCRMTGYSREELASMTIADIEAKETRDVVVAHAQEILRKGEDRFETQYRRKDGNIIDVEVSVVATSRHGGQFVTFHHDITERNRARAEIQAALNTLEQKVLDRTRELNELNQNLEAEVALRIKAEEDIRASLKEKEILLREIHHRVKNNLQVISSLVSLQLRVQKDESVRALLKDSQDRIRSIAFVHEKLYQTANFESIDYADYLARITKYLFESFNIESNRVILHLSAGHVLIPIDKAVPISLIVNEMLTNSLKHAFPKMRKGEISIDFSQKDNMFIFIFQDNGVGIPESVTFEGAETMGMRLISSLTEQLRGTIELDRTGGTKYTLIFPLGKK